MALISGSTPSDRTLEGIRGELSRNGNRLNLSHRKISQEFLQKSLSPLEGLLPQMQSLKTIDLSHCGLTQIPDQLKTLSSLQDLLLDSNKIETLPKWLGKSALRLLSLMDNRGLELKKEDASHFSFDLKIILDSASYYRSWRGHFFLKYENSDQIQLPSLVNLFENLGESHLLLVNSPQHLKVCQLARQTFSPSQSFPPLLIIYLADQAERDPQLPYLICLKAAEDPIITFNMAAALADQHLLPHLSIAVLTPDWPEEEAGLTMQARVTKIDFENVSAFVANPKRHMPVSKEEFALLVKGEPATKLRDAPVQPQNPVAEPPILPLDKKSASAPRSNPSRSAKKQLSPSISLEQLCNPTIKSAKIFLKLLRLLHKLSDKMISFEFEILASQLRNEGFIIDLDTFVSISQLLLKLGIAKNRSERQLTISREHLEFFLEKRVGENPLDLTPFEDNIELKHLVTVLKRNFGSEAEISLIGKLLPQHIPFVREVDLKSVLELLEKRGFGTLSSLDCKFKFNWEAIENFERTHKGRLYVRIPNRHTHTRDLPAYEPAPEFLKDLSTLLWFRREAPLHQQAMLIALKFPKSKLDFLPHVQRAFQLFGQKEITAAFGSEKHSINVSELKNPSFETAKIFLDFLRLLQKYVVTEGPNLQYEQLSSLLRKDGFFIDFDLFSHVCKILKDLYLVDKYGVKTLEINKKQLANFLERFDGENSLNLTFPGRKINLKTFVNILLNFGKDEVKLSTIGAECSRSLPLYSKGELDLLLTHVQGRILGTQGNATFKFKREDLSNFEKSLQEKDCYIELPDYPLQQHFERDYLKNIWDAIQSFPSIPPAQLAMQIALLFPNWRLDFKPIVQKAIHTFGMAAPATLEPFQSDKLPEAHKPDAPLSLEQGPSLVLDANLLEANPKAIGLPNVKHDCFFNAAIQLILHQNELRNFILLEPCEDEGLKNFLTGFVSMYKAGKTAYQSATMRKVLGFSTEDQEDADELLKIIFRKYDLTGLMSSFQRTFTINLAARQKSTLSMEARTEFEPGQNQLVVQETGFFLSVPILPSGDLQDWLNRLFSEELAAEFTFKQGGELYSVPSHTRKLTATRFGDSMFLQINRFSSSGYKIATALGLNVMECTLGGTKYNIMGFLVHSGGPTLKSGHYCSYSVTPSGWMGFNDSQVSPVSDEEVLKQVNHAYILYLVKAK